MTLSITAKTLPLIDNTVENSKEAILQIMEVWYLWAIDTQNYGFFVKILEEFRKKIKNDAQVRAHDLQMSLDVYLKENGSWEEDELISKAVAQIRERIEQQNYAAAEDLLNRVITHDLDLDVTVQQEDYLEKFFDEYDISNISLSSSETTFRYSHKSLPVPKRSFVVSMNRLCDAFSFKFPFP